MIVRLVGQVPVIAVVLAALVLDRQVLRTDRRRLGALAVVAPAGLLMVVSVALPWLLIRNESGSPLVIGSTELVFGSGSWSAGSFGDDVVVPLAGPVLPAVTGAVIAGCAGILLLRSAPLRVTAVLSSVLAVAALVSLFGSAWSVFVLGWRFGPGSLRLGLWCWFATAIVSATVGLSVNGLRAAAVPASVRRRSITVLVVLAALLCLTPPRTDPRFQGLLAGFGSADSARPPAPWEPVVWWAAPALGYAILALVLFGLGRSRGPVPEASPVVSVLGQVPERGVG